MLGKTLHIRHSCFRMLPNPTPYHWDKKFFSLRKLMKEFRKAILNDDIVQPTAQIFSLTNMAEKIIDQLLGDPLDFRIPLLEALREALDRCDEYLTDKVSRELTLMVLREHFQQVLRMINEEEDGGEEEEAGDRSAPLPRFDDLNSASPEERQQTFMDIYFAVVLQDVRQRAVTAFNRRKSTRYAPSNHGRDPSVSSTQSAPIPDVSGTSRSPSPQPPADWQHPDSLGSIPLVSVSPANPRTLSDPTFQRIANITESLETYATDIWCTLVFRMLAWLLLHDFHKKDVQIPKTELLGSRLPVYIS